MKEVFYKTDSHGNKLIVWKNELDESTLLNKCILDSNSNKKFLHTTSSKRRIEFLALRVLIQTVFKNNTQLHYHQSGQPYINETKHLSISHSNNYIAIAFGELPIGIDIELPQKKMLSLMKRILSEKENIFYGTIKDQKLACKIWGAKEAILKCIGDKKLDYKNGISTENINKGIVKEKDTIYKVCFYKVENMILTSATPLDNHKVQ